MPHQRPRALLDILLKRTQLWPVVGVVGPRQSGKSVLLREIFAPLVEGEYRTLDSLRLREKATRSPESFAELLLDGRPLIIDEIQKSPDLFDAIKLHVDQNRRPGMYVISGSTEFSKLTGIRESLTGRIGVLHLYPMNLSELHQRALGSYFVVTTKHKGTPPISMSDFDRKLERGGMPGLCFMRDEAEFRLSCDAWLDTTCHRDLQQVRGRGLDGGLALAILEKVATAPEPTAPVIARALRRDARIIQRYLDALEAVLVLHKLAPHAAGVGKPHYLLCDSGLAAHLGASRETQIRTHLLSESLAAFENAGLGKPWLQYYRNAKTSRVPIVLSWPGGRKATPSVAIQFYDGESPGTKDMASLTAFAAKLKDPMRLLFLTQSAECSREGSVEIWPLRG
jgi:predicted AAA+ superfamily ATPase